MLLRCLYYKGIVVKFKRIWGEFRNFKFTSGIVGRNAPVEMHQSKYTSRNGAVKMHQSKWSSRNAPVEMHQSKWTSRNVGRIK